MWEDACLFRGVQILLAVLAREYDWEVDLEEPLKTFHLPVPAWALPRHSAESNMLHLEALTYYAASLRVLIRSRFSKILFLQVLLPAVHAIIQRCPASEHNDTCCTSKHTGVHALSQAAAVLVTKGGRKLKLCVFVRFSCNYIPISMFQAAQQFMRHLLVHLQAHS